MSAAKSDRTKMGPSGRGRLPKRGEKEPVPGTRKVNGESGTRLWHEAKRWYILLGLSIVISVFLSPDIMSRPKIYGLGDVAGHDIKASREFLVENAELTERNRQMAVKDVLYVYDFDSTGSNAVSKIREAFKEGREYLAEFVYSAGSPAKAPSGYGGVTESQPTRTDSFKEQFFKILDIPPDEKLFDTLIKNDFSHKVEEATIGLVTKVCAEGIVSNQKMLMSHKEKGINLQDIHTKKEIKISDLDRFYDLKGAEKVIKGQGVALEKVLESRKLIRASLEIALGLLRPNLTFNSRETELRKDLARKSVKPFYFKVKKGEMLVREGERIGPEHLLKLSEQYRFLKREEMVNRAPAMLVLVGFLLFIAYFGGLINGRMTREGVKDLLFYSLTLLVVFLVVIASNFVASEMSRSFPFLTARALLFAIPVASGAMLISIFQGMSVAVSFSLIISVLASLVLGGRVDLFVYFFISCFVAAHGVRICSERGVFIKAGLKVGLSNAVLALSVEALYGSVITWSSLVAICAAFSGGILVGVIATGIQPLIEMSFGYTTDIKLLELANLDQPLLRELMVRAPGTHHHSVIVSNMVEATAQAINANPLLAKVAGYYHDIGKITKPIYFIENQKNGQNRHEKLAPSMSSLILISHVKDGVELARKYKLDRELIDIIKQHHGTSLISFFYEKAREQAEKKGKKSHLVKEEDFRYPGPKPQTKEAGLVMLADAVEAASRTLIDPTAARIQGLVQKIINRVFSDGQLGECELTLKDLNAIAKSFNKTLSGIFHHRVEYPDSVSRATQPKERDLLAAPEVSPLPGAGANSRDAEGSSKKKRNGDTDHLPSENSRAGVPQDKAKAQASLKRLGLS
jgi:putative nucleotidyltransferase with HDIG domain